MSGFTSPHRACPVCSATEPRLIFRQEFEAIDGVSIINGYDVVTCGHCGMAYADRIPVQARFDDYYRDLSKYEYHQRGGEESSFDRARMDVIATVVAPLIHDANSRILDIGCASGRLLFLLAQRGFMSVTGLDPSPGCVDAARRLYDIEVLQGNVGRLKDLDRVFDVVILVGVLEHIRDLSEAMERISGIVAPRGTVYVEVPDALEFTSWPNAPFQDFSVEHINFFSPVSLTNLFKMHGFDSTFVEQNHRVQAFGTIMSNISAAFRKGGPAERPIETDEQSHLALGEYVAQSSAEEARLRTIIDQLVDSRRPLVVWGVGTNATRLLTTTRLSEANITAFVDSNTKYHGKTVAGRPILSPAELEHRTEPIVVLSRAFQNEIVRQIHETLGGDRECITLYDVR